MARQPAGQTEPDTFDPGQLEVFIDLRSPYSYVALSPVRVLAQKFSLKVNWRPYEIDVEAAYGAASERDARALRKVKYIYMDARRFAAPQGLVIRGPKRIYDARNAHIAFLFAKRTGLLDPFLDVVYERFFSHAIEIEDRAALAALITELSGSQSAYQTFAEGPGPGELEAETRHADALGVFGVPSFVYGDALFWGADRLTMLEQAIADVVGQDISPGEIS